MSSANNTRTAALIRQTGLWIFLGALGLFTSLTFIGRFDMTPDALDTWLSQSDIQSVHFAQRAKALLTDRTFDYAWQMTAEISNLVDENNRFQRSINHPQDLIYTSVEELGLRAAKLSAAGVIASHKTLFLFLTIFMGFAGALAFMMPAVFARMRPGNHHVYHDSVTNRGPVAWLALVYLIGFYLVLYFRPSVLTNMTLVADPVSEMMSGRPASQWFLYGFLYCMAMKAMGVRMWVKYRHNKYQVFRTFSVVFFQLIFAFLLVEILPMFQLPAVDLKNAWPLDYGFLFDYRVKNLFESGNAGKFIFIWGIALTVVIVPVMTYFYGKRWYCSWVCGCGGLAETLGDPFRQHSDKTLKAWRFERWAVHGVLLFAIVMTIWTGWHTYQVFNQPADTGTRDMLLGISAFDIRQWYGLLIGAWFSGVIGTGFYPIFGNRVWCRFGCPLAAYLGIVQRLKSRFRITVNGGQCISCGNCSTYCEMGIDVRAYAQRGQNVVRASCVGCGICAEVCPRGVLKLENGSTVERISDNPILIGRDGARLKGSEII